MRQTFIDKEKSLPLNICNEFITILRLCELNRGLKNNHTVEIAINIVSLINFIALN